MAYLNIRQLRNLGFKRLGVNVKVSTKASIYNPERIELGDNVRIDDFAILSGKIVVGRFVYIAPSCILAGGEKGILLEDFVTLSFGVQIFTQSEDYGGGFIANPTVPSTYTDVLKLAVHLGRHVIIGARTTLIPGVHVAEGCSVGACSLVRKSTKPWGIYIGIPARRLKERKKDLLKLEKKFLESLKN